MNVTINGQLTNGYWRIDNIDHMMAEEEGTRPRQSMIDKLTKPWMLVRDREDAEHIVEVLSQYE